MKICYFGIYKSDYSRNKVYISGLRENKVEIIECQDSSRGLIKYIKLFKKHWRIRSSYDFLVVGYPGHPVVWFAKLISNKPIIFDALCTMEEGVLVSRGQRGFLGLKALYIKFVDWLAVKCADIILVETIAQKEFFEMKFGKSHKYKVVYTGVDEQFFFKDETIKKNEKFTVVFRGKFLPEAGVEHVVQVSKILENDDLNFIIIGNGFLEKEIKSLINELKPKNLNLISEHLSFENLRGKMLASHVSLGQLENHERLERTIPHKCFETLAMGLPYITARTNPVAEILKEGISVLFVNPADPKDLADKILYLKNNPEVAKRIGDNGYQVYKERFTPIELANDIMSILREYKK